MGERTKPTKKKDEGQEEEMSPLLFKKKQTISEGRGLMTNYHIRKNQIISQAPTVIVAGLVTS